MIRGDNRHLLFESRKEDMRTYSWLASAATAVLVTGIMVQGHENDPKRNPQPPIYGEIVYGSPDSDGSVAGFDSEGIIYASQVPINAMGGSGNGSDLWGYTSPSGREYAIMTTNGACSLHRGHQPVPARRHLFLRQRRHLFALGRCQSRRRVRLPCR